MKKHNWIITEICIGAVFAVSMLLSYLCEPSRIASFLFGVIALIAFCASIVSYIIDLKSNRLPISLTAVFIALLFHVGLYRFLADSTDSQMLFYITIPCIASILIAFVTVIVTGKTSKFKTAILSLICNIAVCFFMIFIMMMFLNYALDLTESTLEEFVITAEAEKYSRDAIGGTLEYPVEYTGDNSEVNISKLELKGKYKFEIGDKITVIWRRGLFEQTYMVDYSNAVIDEEYLP